MFFGSLAWVILNAAARRRLDGFHARCLRQILGVKPSFISKVSNVEVRAKAGGVHRRRVSLLDRQLRLFGRAARAAPGNPIRDVLLEPGTLTLKATGPRSRGRPRINWGAAVRKHAVEAATGEEQLAKQVNDPRLWERAVRTYCNRVSETF